jgi:hypothetical protein
MHPPSGTGRMLFLAIMLSTKNDDKVVAGRV